ncbi:iron-sulfur cluster assembly scaffold protein [Porticoccus sp. GXU_MW_L64]
MDKSYYQSQLLEHYKNPVGSGEVTDEHRQGVGSNPLCGDEICVGVKVIDGVFAEIRFKARACSICIASASMMNTLLSHQPVAQAAVFREQLQRLFAGDSGENDLPEVLQPLAAIVPMRSRHKCTLIGWEALNDALAE